MGLGKRGHKKNKGFFNASHNKSAQIQLTFNWVYVLIAGAVILLFFVGIVVKQKASAEEHLALDVVRIMESIFTGAGVSEKTKNFIDTSGLIDYTLYFNCESGLGEFGIKDKGSPAQNLVDPIFSPLELKTSLLILWSLPYKLPFKVIDFMFVTSKNTKYFLVGGTDFAEEFVNAIVGSNVVQIPDLSFINPEKNFQVRVVDLDGVHVKTNSPVPESLKLMDDNKVSAVVFTAANQVDYYQKKDNGWKRLNPNPVRIISLGGERDAAKYAAIFSGNHIIYRCNMKKAFQRLRYLTEVYGEKAKEMEQYYTERPELSLTKECLNHIQVSGYEPNINGALESLQGSVAACLLKGDLCTDLFAPAEALREVNKNLGEKGDCLTLY